MSAAGIGRENQDAVAGRKAGARVADESVPVEVRDKRRLQAAGVDDGVEPRKSALERGQKSAQRVRVELQLGDAGTLTGDAQKLNSHQCLCYHVAPGTRSSGTPVTAARVEYRPLYS